eukprot:1936982-Prymnesium_polylepis.1
MAIWVENTRICGRELLLGCVRRRDGREVARCIAEAFLVDRSEPDFLCSPSLAWQVASKAKLGGAAKALGGRRRGAVAEVVFEQ